MDPEKLIPEPMTVIVITASAQMQGAIAALNEDLSEIPEGMVGPLVRQKWQPVEPDGYLNQSGLDTREQLNRYLLAVSEWCVVNLKKCL